MNPDDLLRAKLNQETSQLPWSELLRYFASGDVIAVSAQLDLIEIALHISNDNTALIQPLLATQLINKVSDEQAQAWLDADAQLWTVVVKPWILVQHRDAPQTAALH